ncbi:long-chain-fatty-acid--CoA ligase ACSBG2-like [Macrobrachium nipponense]|uniref:long-chain-fatty-acid--CoA ligase ACSBG2-like n=1 Tax=Macrobrachium nipponense TaxID=159736 RepID=UPI0030C88A2B
MVPSLAFSRHKTLIWIARMSFKAHRNMSATTQTNTYRNGPDQILPATSIKAWTADGAVRLQISEEEMKTRPPISVHTLMHKRATKNSNAIALAAKKDGKWKYWTYKDYYDESRIAAKAFIKLGLERFKGVCIMGGNAPEWVIANFGAIFAGGLSAGVYPTSTPEACRYLADNCKAQILVLEDKACLDRFLAVKDSLPSVKAIVQWSGSPGATGVLSWSDLMDMGKLEPDDELNERLSLAAVNQCCYLTYTSGTTGPPKGVMCSQDNLTYVGELYRKNNNHEFGKERLVSYLPLSHIAAQVVDIYTCITILGELYFAEPDALKGTLVKTLTEAQPTGFMGVPRVWEKMYESLMRAGTQAPLYKKILAKWAKEQGLQYYKAVLENRKLSVYEQVSHSLAKKLVLNKIKEAIGFGKLHQCVSVAAPVDDYLLEYFLSLDIPVVNVYGMSENITVCAFSYAEQGRFKIGSCGKVAPQIEVCIKSIPGGTPGEGEIIMKGRPVCMGYLEMPEKTHEAIDDEGWLHSGDVGHFDEEGFLYITARIKELIITAGGENVPPVIIEEIIKKELPFISNAMLVGDNKKFLSLLLTLKAEVDEITAESLPELTPYCKRVLTRMGCEARTVAEALDEVKKNPNGALAKAIQEGIDRYNDNHAVSNAQKIRNWRLLPADFSSYSGEYNNTLKLKRFYVLDKYKDLIDSMYSVPHMTEEF